MADPNESMATTDIFERGRPLYFAGRHAEMSRLARYLRALRSNGDATMGMVLIDGVQGIGKTQLALEFARRQCAGGSSSPASGLRRRRLGGRCRRAGGRADERVAEARCQRRQPGRLPPGAT